MIKKQRLRELAILPRQPVDSNCILIYQKEEVERSGAFSQFLPLWQNERKVWASKLISAKLDGFTI